MSKYVYVFALVITAMSLAGANPASAATLRLEDAAGASLSGTTHVVASQTRSVKVVGLANGDVVSASSSDSSVAVEATAIADGAGEAVFTLTGASSFVSPSSGTGTATVTFSFGGDDASLTVTTSRYLRACSASGEEAPCVVSATLDGVDQLASLFDMSSTGVTITSRGWDLGWLYVDPTTPTAVGDIVVKTEASSSAGNYFMLSKGRVISLEYSLAGGSEIVHAEIRAARFDSVPNSGAGPFCMPGNCDENLVATRSDYMAWASLFRVNAPDTGIDIPQDFAGGWSANNGQFFTLNEFTAGDLGFSVGAPHFQASTPSCSADGAGVATDPSSADCLLNSGYLDVFIPQGAITNVFDLPGVTQANCWTGATFSGACRDELAVTQNKNSDVIDLIAGTTFDFSSASGLLINTSGISYSESTLKVGKFVPAPEPTPNPGGGSGGAAQPTQVVEPAAAVPVNILTPGSVISNAPEPVFMRNPDRARLVSQQIWLLGNAEAQAIPDRVMRKAPGVWIAKSPRVRISKTQPVSLVTAGFGANAIVNVKLRIGKQYYELGVVQANSDGELSLPVFRVDSTRANRLALVDETTGTTKYIRLLTA